MSADDWEPCPRCYTEIKELFNEHKDSKETPLNFDEIKNIELLKEVMDTGWPKDISETDIEKEHLVSAEDKLRESNEYETKDLLPTSDNTRPVEVRYEWSVDEDIAWFSLMAVCRNCGHEYEVEKR
jgi:hypothetical protein